ncbi:MAG TPA: hypothetical protein EYQ54_16520 [Myxococcales bacterium]|jgi:hypothetical protein|nr:hypothetical protein [Myxococcales bacterium]
MQIGSVIGARRAARVALSSLALVGLASIGSAQTLVGPGIELREGALVVASAPVLSNGSGTLHIESSTLGELAGGRAVGLSGIQLLSGAVPIPEPAALLQLGSGALGLTLLGRRRRLRSPSPARKTENS